MQYYLAIDIGASSGRHILGYIQNGKLKIEEIYRFENGFKSENGSLVWDLNSLLENVKIGIKKCAEIKKIPKTIAIDTWGVDYALLDKDKNVILPSYCYRDNRTNNIVSKVENIVSFDRLYFKTGIQKQCFNTIYQLYSDKIEGRLENAEYFLMIPEYLSYCLTGKIKKEYTNATTSSLINAEDKNWDFDIIDELNLPRGLFSKLFMPGEEYGEFSSEIRKEVGFNCTVIFAPSHDTASAVAATPMNDNDLYISSGTWSLIGIESIKPVTNLYSKIANFTNEGGIDYRFRILKNYMGMWLFQNIRNNIDKSLTYDEMMKLAQKSKSYKYLNVNDETLIAPANMIEAIRTYFSDPKMSLEEILNCIYHSLAKTYSDAVLEIEDITSKKINAIHIVGGGSKDSYLNKLTSEYTGKPVTAGPVEATAIGNILSQLIFNGDCNNIQEGRALIKSSFNITEFN